MLSRKWKTHNQAQARLLLLVLIFAALCVCTVISPAHAGPISEHEGKLNGQKKELEALESDIHGLLEHKRHTQDPKQVQEIMQELAAKHKKLAQVSKEYDEIRLHVRFKHPDQNEKVERKYVRYKLRTLKEMEDEFGIDGKLDRIKARVLATFPAPASEKKANPEHDDPNGHRKPANQETDEYGFESTKLVK